MLAESRGMLNLLIKAICFVLSDLLHPKLHEVMSFIDRKSTRLNSSHSQISYAVFCLKKKTCVQTGATAPPTPPSPFAQRLHLTARLVEHSFRRTQPPQPIASRDVYHPSMRPVSVPC